MKNKLHHIFKNIIIILKKIIIFIFRKTLLVLNKIKRFFQNKKILLIVIVLNILIEGTAIIVGLSRQTIPWVIVLGFPFVSAAWVSAYYVNQNSTWIKIKSKYLKKITPFFTKIAILLTPVFSFYLSMNQSKIYFQDRLQKYETVFLVAFIIIQFLFIIKYCIDFWDINNNVSNLKQRIIYFLFAIIHVIQLFANIFVIIATLDNNAFSNTTFETPFELSFDFTYFSAMTFITADGGIVPESRLAQTFVLIESFIFTIYISTIILGIIADRNSKNSNNE